MESVSTYPFTADMPTDAGEGSRVKGRGRRVAGAHARKRHSPVPRTESIGLMSISLGTAGLGGAWQSASAVVTAPTWVSDAFFALSALVWVLLLARYLRHGGWHWRNVLDDLSHPGQGFTLAYVPIVGMLAAGHIAQYDLDGARWAYAPFAATAAVIAARLLAHWVTGGLSSAPLHPGYLLPVVSAPFISSSVASTLRIPEVASATFAVGVLYWLALGTVVLGNLVAHGGSMPEPARPTLTILIIPPAAGGLAWTAAHHGVLDAVGYGFAGLLLFSVLIVAFLLPKVRQRSFHYGYWIFSFPAAVSVNFLVRWLAGTDVTGWQATAWLLLAAVTVAFVPLYAVTLRHALHHRPGTAPADHSAAGRR